MASIPWRDILDLGSKTLAVVIVVFWGTYVVVVLNEIHSKLDELLKRKDGEDGKSN